MNTSVSSSRRAVLASVLVAVVLVLGGCGRLSLPRVPEDAIQAVEGPGVTIAETAEESNPTEQWIYTYLLLEVVGEPPHVDLVEAALVDNGWRVEEFRPDPRQQVEESSILLIAQRPAEDPTADLTLDPLDDYLAGGSSSIAIEAFSAIERDPKASYYVAILAPLEG